MIQATRLHDELQRYFRARAVAPSTEYRMGRSLRLFIAWLERDATAADLSDDSVNDWLRSLERTHAPKSVKEFRGDLLALWRWLSGQQICEHPREVRRVRLGDPCPISWTEDEAVKIIEQCRRLRGVLPNGASRRIYCEALFRFGYETGLRRSDAWTVRRNQIRPDGTIVLRQHKTGHAHWPRIREVTIALLARLPGDPPLACPYRTTSRWYSYWRRYVTGPAGVRHGAMQQIRRTGATLLAIDHPEAVQRYLGHRSPEMQRHYIDWSIARPAHHMPPDLATNPLTGDDPPSERG